MHHITLLPYLGRTGQLDLWDGIKVWNYQQFKERYIPDPALRAQAERIVNMYEKHEWVNVISIDTSSPLRQYDPKTIRRIQLLLFITTIAKGNTKASAIGNDSTSSSAENFSFSSFSLDPRATSVKFKLDPVFKNSCATLPMRNGIIPKPLHIKDRTRDNTQLDTELLAALLALRNGRRRVLEKIYDSAEMMVVPLLNYNLIPFPSVYILITAAFENLLGYGRQSVKNAIDNYFKGNALHPSFVQINGRIRREIDTSRRPVKRTKYALWYEQLVRFRNKVIHGGGTPEQENHSYHGQSHRYIATLMYIACLKGMLEEHTGIVVPGTVLRKKIGGKMWFVYKES